MKRSVLFAFAFISLFALPSCQKNYNCTCTFNNASGTPQTTQGIFYGSKRQARKDCRDNMSKLNKIGSNASCTLK